MSTPESRLHAYLDRAAATIGKPTVIEELYKHYGWDEDDREIPSYAQVEEVARIVHDHSWHDLGGYATCSMEACRAMRELLERW